MSTVAQEIVTAADVGTVKDILQHGHAFRNGQWVLFDAPVALAAILDNPHAPFKKAHKTAGGSYVGIYCRGGSGSPITINGVAVATKTVTRVEPVDEQGTKVRRVSDDGNHVMAAELDPHGLLNMRPLIDRNDIPAARLATYHPEWQPKP
jgi:hypothetical protein